MSPAISDDARAAQRLAWVRHVTGVSSLTLERASVDAGFRSYWRTQGLVPSRIVMDSPPDREDVRPWLKMHDLLDTGGVRVPQIWVRDVDAGWLLLEDLGGPTLAQTLNASNAQDWFDRAIASLIKLQAIPPPADSGQFGPALLQRDAGLFSEWFLGRHLGLVLSAGENQRLATIQQHLGDNALAQAQVLTHRDFMPRNLMPTLPQPAVLDFQDCVRGPVAYDPVSLFKDAFLSWPLAQVDAGLARYHAQARDAGIPVPADVATFLRDADWMGIQRHLKILGIFARLHYRDGKSRYLTDAPRFIHYLEEVLPRHPDLSDLHDLLQQRIKPAMQAQGQA